jgi:hypothetical protein
MEGGRESPDDDEIDPSARQDPNETREVGHRPPLRARPAR